MGCMNLNEVGSDFLASLNGGDVSIFNPLNILLGHRDGLRVIIAERDVTGAVNYSIECVNEDLITKWQAITDHCWANHQLPQAQDTWGL